MGKKQSQSKSNSRALNAFDTAIDDEYYIKGLRQQQDINLDEIADTRIRDYLNNEVNPEDDEEISSDGVMGSDSDMSILNGGNESDWGDSYDESELLPLSAVWDLDDEESNKSANNKAKSTKSGGETSKNSSKSDSDSSDSSGASEHSDSLSFSSDEDVNSSSEEEENEVLNDTIKRAVHSQTSNTYQKLAETTEENPFALNAANSENVDVADFAPTVKNASTLSIRQPKHIQERATRDAAFGIAKKEVQKWADTVSANRQAEHLQFPINPANKGTAASPFEPAVKTDLERNIQNILEQSQLADEKALSTFEELAPSKLSIEEVKERRNQLRYMRELMFREEQRAKRIKKIKSKAYRKIHKKERERMAELDGDMDSSDADNEDENLKAEKARVLERATLRHKNNSKWAKRMREQGMTKDAGTRAEIEEMIRQSESLRQKIGVEMEDENGQESNLGTLSDEERDIDSLERDHEAAGGGDANNNKGGLLGMKFIKDAEQRERVANKQALNDDYEDPNTNIGRMSFDPAGSQLKRDGEHDDDTNTGRKKRVKKAEHGEEIVEFKRSDGRSDANTTTTNREQEQGSPGSIADTSSTTPSSANPWLNLGQSKIRNQVKSNAAANLDKGKLHISLENTLGDSLVRAKDMSLQQQDLVQQVFAGDDVVQQFEAEKQAEISEDKDQIIDETLPGWGSWSNEKPRVQKLRKVVGVNEKQRKDFKRNNVIINEKVNKRTSKYNASAVPFPFENRQQYERSLRMPIGNEWVTKDTFQRQTKPRVIVKKGELIEPIKKPYK